MYILHKYLHNSKSAQPPTHPHHRPVLSRQRHQGGADRKGGACSGACGGGVLFLGEKTWEKLGKHGNYYFWSTCLFGVPGHLIFFRMKKNTIGFG